MRQVGWGKIPLPWLVAPRFRSVRRPGDVRRLGLRLGARQAKSYKKITMRSNVRGMFRVYNNLVPMLASKRCYSSLCIMEGSMRFLMVAALLAASAPALAQQRVDGYTRQNGTYVDPYMRSSPNNTQTDNWSVKPNVNPYTGQAGTHNPQPSYGGGGAGNMNPYLGNSGGYDSRRRY